MTSMHFYTWKHGLKTGQYYLRSRPARDAIKFTVNIEELLMAADSNDNEQLLKCLSMDNEKAFANQHKKKKSTRVEAPHNGQPEKKRKYNEMETKVEPEV
jgi:hypothetical protein